MRILAFFPGHDANFCYFDSSSNNLMYLKYERDVGIKHACAQENKSDSIISSWRNSANQQVPSDLNERKKNVLEYLKDQCDRFNFQPDLIMFTDGWNSGIGGCHIDKLYERWDNTDFCQKGICRKSCDVFCVDHHYAHILSCWPIVPTEKVDVGVSLDNGGDHKLTGRIIKTPASPQLIHTDSKTSVGKMLIRIGKEKMKIVGSVLDIAGKVMGAQSYGTVKKDLLTTIDKQQLFSDIGNNWRTIFQLDCQFGDKEFNDTLATLHQLAEEYITDIFTKHCDPDQVVTYSGGIAQNTVINAALHHRYNKLFIVPHCYDGGLSIGCLELGRILYGLPPIPNNGFPYWQHDECFEEPDEKTIIRVAQDLANGKIVGWFQGKGEIGPRALGNRSILMNPAVQNGKELLNSKVKHREWWRPYAPSILEEEAAIWFEINKPSPYMLTTTKIRTTFSNKVPSVVHVDGTSRIQTVNESQNKNFYRLIREFFKLTGIPMILNTSLNNGGSPIFSTKKQCLKMLNETELDSVCIGNTIHRKILL